MGDWWGGVPTSLHLFAVLGHVVWTDGSKELNVVVTVVLGHLFPTGFMWPLKTHFRLVLTAVV